MDVSIIIINYNTYQMTSECIDSVIMHTSGLEYEIILVDNGSKDGSKQFFENDKRVKYIYNYENKGFGAGNNLGVKFAQGKYVFLLNSDTLLKNNAIKIFYDYSERYDCKGIYGAWMVDRQGNPNQSHFLFPRMGYLQFFKSFTIKPQPEDRTKEVLVDAIVGADIFMSRDVYNAFDGFDENIFMYGEETELQYRLMLEGYVRKIILGPEIVHFGGASSSPKGKSMHIDSHFYFLKKHMPKYLYLSARFYYGVNYLVRWLLHPSKTNMLKYAFMKIKK